MEATNILDVEKFVVECSDMLSGKFFDLRKRLEKFLSVMEKSEDILDLLAECVEGLDYETEFAKSFYIDKKTGAAKVSLPVDSKKKLGLCVSLFDELVNDKLNVNQFLETYFQDKKLTPVQNFLEKVIKSFKDSVCKEFEIDPNFSEEDLNKHIIESMPQEAEEEKEEFPHIDALMAEIAKTSNQILALLKFEKKRTDNLDDLEFVLGAIIQACEKKDLMVVNGLIIGLDYVAKKFKNIKHLVNDLTNLIYDYYDFLDGGVSPFGVISEEYDIEEPKTEE